MISIRVKTQSLEVAISSHQDTLTDVVKATLTIAESQPVQNSLHAPIILKPIESKSTELRQLPLISDSPSETPISLESQRKRVRSGKGEKIVAYNKTKELIQKDFFNHGKAMGEISQALSQKGYSISSGKLADALLMLVRDGSLTREGEKGSYKYQIPEGV